jgi:hypothetical protein
MDLDHLEPSIGIVKTGEADDGTPIVRMGSREDDYRVLPEWRYLAGVGFATIGSRRAATAILALAYDTLFSAGKRE